MREFILYRCDFKCLLKDIPRHINRVFIKENCSKFQKQIDKNRFNNYYEWCCLSFPEYSSDWKLSDFETCVAFDNTVCDSLEEMGVYEKLKRFEPKIQYIGSKINSRHTFIGKYNNKKCRFCPDFVIEEISDKPIYIEYYGMYEENSKSEIFINYKNKTIAKNNFYKNNNDIYFIDIYREDLKNMDKIYSWIDSLRRENND